MNPTLAYPVYLAGYIEHLGTGTIDLIDKCREKGLKTPEFHFDEDGQVIIWRKNVTPDVTPDVTPGKGALRVKNILTELPAKILRSLPAIFQTTENQPLPILQSAIAKSHEPWHTHISSPNSICL